MSVHRQTITATWSALLHDIGKIAYRSGTAGTHSQSGYQKLKLILSDSDILDGVRYHHAQALQNAAIPTNSPAYIVYVADNIASAADRREQAEEGTETGNLFQKYMPLLSVFSYMNGNTTEYLVQPDLMKYKNCPSILPYAGQKLTADSYAHILRELLHGLRCLSVEAEWTNSVLALLEAWTSGIPSSTNTKERADISLFDHQKLTAAAAACISEYLLEQQECDYKTRLWKQERKFWQEDAFLLYSADFSGIQNFIYTIASDKALKALRSRSFFLELAMEHYIDELLDACGVSRANLLYSGGGHCYLLLPNTELAKNSIVSCNRMMNDWLRERFGTRLYLADGYTACSANELTNQPRETAPYKDIFARVSQQIAQRKIHRYSAKDILALNKGSVPDDGRECKICGTVSQLVSESRCRWCKLFEDISNDIQNNDNFVYVISEQAAQSNAIELPTVNGSVYLTIANREHARTLLKKQSIRRVYTKNERDTGLKYSTQLFMGDYHASNQLNELADAASGIRRIAVCRMDVDNLGKAFISGFEQNSSMPEKRYQYVTLSRTAAFSRQMSLFFKYYINSILDGLQVTIVYSGGDDVFLVGAWDAVIDAAQLIQEQFTKYTCGTLTLSAGILLQPARYPIRRSAAKSQELESFSKEKPGKNAITLFEAADSQRYDWQVFAEKVMGEKLQLLEQFFRTQQHTENGRGKAFLYRLLQLLRSADEKINLARFAYTLARMEPKQNSPDYSVYVNFSKAMYEWYLSENDRKQLITAIYIYVYLTRLDVNTDGEL